MADSLAFAYRSVQGVFLKRGIKNPSDVLTKYLNVRTNVCRAMQFSNNGKFLAYCDSERTVCINTFNGEELFSHPFARPTRIMFSPDDRLLITYEPYVIYGSRTDEEGNQRVPDPNLRFIDTTSGELLATLIQRNQTFWEPQFTADGQSFVLVENSELHFFESSTPDRYTRKNVIRGIQNLSVSPGKEPIIAVFVPSNNEPNLMTLRTYSGDVTTIAQKTTFNADKCDFLWNCKGTGCLAKTSVEVDKSNKSYYGVNHVFLLTKSGDSISVTLSKQGPIHDIKWSPTGNQFAICFGYMPSKIAIFNLKGSVIWDFGENHRNEIYYNTFGTILATCGFGNISSGKIQMWNTEKREEIVSLEVPNTTYFEWAPDGKHFLTATTSPRMRVDNNFRIWNYLGEEMFEDLMQEASGDGSEKKMIELAQVSFKPSPGLYSPFKITMMSAEDKKKMAEKRATVDGHPANQLKKAGVVTSNSVYVPPALRKAANSQPVKADPQPKQPTKEISESEKKARTLKKKLTEIEALQKRKDNGETLEKNQQAKLDKFDELKAELDSILSSVGA